MGQTAPAETADAGCSAAPADPSRAEHGAENAAPFSLITDRRTGETSSDGLFCGNVYGTYVHGVFDAPGVARRTVQALAAEKGLFVGAGADAAAEGLSITTGTGVAAEGTDREEDMDLPDKYKEAQYDALAATLREHLDMEIIYRILKEGA